MVTSHNRVDPLAASSAQDLSSADCGHTSSSPIWKLSIRAEGTCRVSNILDTRHTEMLSCLLITTIQKHSLMRTIVVEADIDGMYLHEVVFHTHPVERGWFPYMISDECCLHSLLFSTGVLETTISQAGISQRACFHYSQTLRLLQARLNDPKQAHATSDATIMVVLFLASMAHVANEHTTAAIHIKGMEKMLRLRGGLQSLGSHHNMQVKVCR